MAGLTTTRMYLVVLTMTPWIPLVLPSPLEQIPVEENVSEGVIAMQRNINHSLTPEIVLELDSSSVKESPGKYSKNDTDGHLIPIQTLKENNEFNDNGFKWVLQSLADTLIAGPKRKGPLLHYLAEANAVDAVRALLAAGVSTATRDEQGETPLHWAVRGRAHDVIRLLLESGADPNARAPFGSTPIVIAAQRDDTEAFRMLIRRSSNKLPLSRTASEVLHSAISWRSYNIIKALIEDISAFPKQLLKHAWETAIHSQDYAAIRLLVAAKVDEDDTSMDTSMVYRINELTQPGLEDVLKKVLDAGADPNALAEFHHLSPLMSAASYNNPKSIKILVEAGARLEDVDRQGKTALLHAADSGGVEALSALVHLGANVNATAKNGENALHRAVMRSEASTAILLEAGIDREARNIGGMTPVFMWADESPQALRRLLRSHVDLNKRDHSNRTPLMHHILNGDTNGTDVLLDVAPDVNVSDEDGNTALLLIARQDLGNRWFPAFQESDVIPMLKKIVTAGADVDAQDFSGKSALHWFASKDYALAVEYLLRAGADKDIRDVRGYAPIHCAAKKGRINALKKLLESGVDADTRDRMGCTALMVAAENNQWYLIPVLIRAGAKIDAQDYSGRTALHLAAKTALRNQDSGIEALRSLVQEGANINAIDNSSQTPLHYAVDEVSVLEELLKSGSDKNAQDVNGLTPLHLAMQKNLRLSVRKLLQAEADINVQDKTGKTLAMSAAENNNVRALQMLSKSGVDLTKRDDAGNTALHWATVNGSVNALRGLIKMGVAVNARDNAGKTPLHLAAERNNLKALEALIAAGAEVNLADASGSTALHLAARRGGERVVRKLLQAGADVNAEDNEKKTPLQDAVSCKDASSAALLISAGADVNQMTEGKTSLVLANEKSSNVQFLNDSRH